MYKSVKSDKDCHLWDVINLDTGKRIPFVQWANDKTGEYEILLQDDKGNWIEEWINGFLEIKTELRKGNIKLVRKSKEEQNG